MGESIRFPRERVQAVMPEIIALRRTLHAIPEIGLDLPETAKVVEDFLRRLGLQPRRVGCGLWVDIGTQGPLIAIRADMDALPLEEKTGLAWVSGVPGRMHACGHDTHTACLLGAAKLLKQEDEQNPLSFRVRLIFQTGEESHFGALPLVEAGVLEGVAAIVAGHVGAVSSELQPGQAGFVHGPMMAASDRFRGTFIGSGGHGSEPSRTSDPITAVAEYIQALNGLRAREVDQRKPAVVSVCSVRGGEAFNVIPERVDFMGTARSFHADIREFLAKRIAAIARSIADMRGLALDFQWIDGYPPVVNDANVSRLALSAAQAVLGEQGATTLSLPIMGGEDFAFYLQRVPGCFWVLNTQSPEKGIIHPNHSPRFDVDEDLLWILVAVNLAAAEKLAFAIQP